MKPFIESNDIQHNTEALRQRAKRDGYLFFRDFVNKESVLETRRDITAIIRDVGWIDEGTDPMDGITTHPVRLAGTPEFTPVYDTILKLESFNTLAHDPAIYDCLERILGPDVLLQPSNIARVIFPNADEHTTPAHQDFVHIQGTPDVWTAWMPLGACPEDMGGLTVLTGSHKVGILPVSRSLGAGGLRTHTEDVDGEWVSSTFNLGDMLFFHSHTVHKGLPNRSGNQLRLSVDYRYQSASDPVMEKVLTPHQNRLTWPEVYAGWKSEKYQYHWEQFTLMPVPKQKWEVEEVAA
ncbi:MAG: phytanoyl-CoA dioxygenase family protein [Chloroflexota bacterium]